MTALTATDFLAAGVNAAAEYPNASQFLQARDPRVLQQLGANAVMLSMLSAQVEAAKYEPFLKARDGTVMADAALKGILPLGRACRLTLSLVNSGSDPVTLGAQRRLLDPKGRIYELDSAVTVPANGSATVTATQIRRRSITNKVLLASDFYRIQVQLSDDEMYLNTLQVSRGADIFTYAPDWFNVAVGDLAYQVEVDELRQMFVRFGRNTVIGYGVQQGDEFTLDITECNGRISDLSAGGTFTLEYIYSGLENNLKLTLVSVEDEGAAPHTIQELRVMARYPAIYDHNAVYLGEFEFLLRRYITGIRFLSVWNEQIEEAVRGASINNINALFVSGLVAGMTDAAFQDRARTLIKRADDSYRLVFVNAVSTPVPVTITGSIAISWDRATVESQIRALLLEQFGDGSINVSQGMRAPIKQAQINRLLRENIDALRDDKAEYSVAITLPATPLPEHFLHIASASLTVTLTNVDYGGSLWNT